MKRLRSKKTCHKVAYDSQEAAKQALREFGRDRGAKRVYKCPHHNCETWHLTSQSKGKK